MADDQTRWIARLTPETGKSVEQLLALSTGLDVWERHTSALVVAASDAQLEDLERRRLARVERLSTVADYLARSSDSQTP
jgi:hypothetical protein